MLKIGFITYLKVKGGNVMKITPNNIVSLTQLMDIKKSEEEDKRTIVEIMLNKKAEDEEDEEETSNNARVVKAMKRNIRMEKIAAKIASGKGIGIDEENYVLKYNPGLIHKARIINSERKALEEKINLCKTKEEAENLLRMYREKGLYLSFSNQNIEEPNVGKVIISAANTLDESTLKERKDKEKKENEKKQGKIDLLV